MPGMRAHLNINFVHLLDARGIFAELAGVLNLSDATHALLKRPSLQNRTNATSALSRSPRMPAARMLGSHDDAAGWSDRRST